MAQVKKYIAVDLGAESGRVMLGSVSDNEVILEEIHRFDNGPIEENGTLRWDFDKLLSKVKIGITKAVKTARTCTANTNAILSALGCSHCVYASGSG